MHGAKQGSSKPEDDGLTPPRLLSKRALSHAPHETKSFRANTQVSRVTIPMSGIVDDKSEHCIPFILERLKLHREPYESKGDTPPPFFVGVNGCQGSGKTTLVETLSDTLSSSHGLLSVVLSIDDLYLPHDRQEKLAEANPDNPLVQHRGQPSTHDLELGKDLFQSLADRKKNVKVPSYDKSAFNGAGDQKTESEWPAVNAEGNPPVEIVIFEGWCVGFRALTEADLEKKWKSAKNDFKQNGDSYKGQLGKQTLESVSFVNDNLKSYDAMTDRFGAFIHIDAEDPLYVYDWRLEPERKMREEKGSGMSDEQVINFINGYYPAYELYTDVLRNGIFGDEKGKQLRLLVDKNRRVKEVQQI